MNFFDTWPIWAWFVTSFGFAGVIAFIVVAPALAGSIFSGLLRFLGAVIKTPIGAAIVFGLIAFGLGWYAQGIRLEGLCNQRIEDARNEGIAAGKAADASTAKKAAEFDNTAQGWIDAASTKREEITGAPPKSERDNECRVTKDQLDWLQRIK